MITKGVKELCAEAEAEIETVTAQEAIKIAEGEAVQLVDIRDIDGKMVRDPDSQKPIMKATKCDLCETNPGGPACVRACPHDALKRVNFKGDETFGAST